MSFIAGMLGEGAAQARRAMRTSEHLREQVLGIAAGAGTVLVHAERAWASITFTGTRHTLEIRFEGDVDASAGEALIEQLAEHEFTIPGQLVADAAIVDVEDRMLPHRRLTVTADILLLEDC